MTESELPDKCKETKTDHRVIITYEAREVLKKRGLDPTEYYWCNLPGPIRRGCKYHDRAIEFTTIGLCKKVNF